MGWEDPWVGKIPWRRKWQPTPIALETLLPGKSHGQRRLEGYSPRGRKKSDTMEQLHFHFQERPIQKLNESETLISQLIVVLLLRSLYENV